MTSPNSRQIATAATYLAIRKRIQSHKSSNVAVPYSKGEQVADALRDSLRGAVWTQGVAVVAYRV